MSNERKFLVTEEQLDQYAHAYSQHNDELCGRILYDTELSADATLITRKQVINAFLAVCPEDEQYEDTLYFLLAHLFGHDPDNRWVKGSVTWK